MNVPTSLYRAAKEAGTNVSALLTKALSENVKYGLEYGMEALRSDLIGARSRVSALEAALSVHEKEEAERIEAGRLATSQEELVQKLLPAFLKDRTAKGDQFNLAWLELKCEGIGAKPIDVLARLKELSKA